MSDKFENVSTKVATEVKEQLNRILKSMGLNEYQWLQMMIEVTIRMINGEDDTDVSHGSRL